MSKKNIKSNKKKSVRGNYKIEALEPRLMMDGDPTGSEQQWLSEVNQYKDSYNDIMSESYRNLNAKIDGLFVAKDENLEQATYGSLLEIRADAKKWTIFSKPLAEQTQVASFCEIKKMYCICADKYVY